MAYLSFSPWAAENGAAVRTATASDVIRFTPLELRVIAFAERVDATREMSRQSRVGRFLERAFGVKLNPPLASPRLESLRRFASLARHHPQEVAEADLQNLVSSGFSQGQAHGLLTYFSARQAQSHRPRVA